MINQLVLSLRAASRGFSLCTNCVVELSSPIYGGVMLELHTYTEASDTCVCS